ncbi:CNNM domain-containing protein [Planctomycetes bacterium K23_9]|uniref:Magnesium and cobalt efflux protein CorC n=1 Tax=Stieleria marina TaxID=1930275 RepID=A0A517P013_9BACT|nr:Magnesium and cobalt efflux protein CorC [Planctomycetes bacterium K23_9]
MALVLSVEAFAPGDLAFGLTAGLDFMLFLVLSIACFLGLSGMMAAVDAAILSVTHPEVDVLVQRGKWGAHRLSQVKLDLSQSVVVIVIISNTINVLGPVLVSLQAFELRGSEGVAIITAVLTLGTIVFSEIVPKSIGAHYAPFISRISAPAILACRYVLYPFVIVFAGLSKLFTKGDRQIGTEAQVRSLVRIGRLAGHIENDESEMIHRVFVLNDKTAGGIMTPLDRMKVLGRNFTLQQASSQVLDGQHSRYPVFGQTTDEIAGVVLAREILRDARSQPRKSLESIIRPALIVEAETKSDSLIELFREHHAQMAIVQDSGKTVGLVTFADVLSQLIPGTHALNRPVQ